MRMGIEGGTMGMSRTGHGNIDHKRGSDGLSSPERSSGGARGSRGFIKGG